VTERVDLNNETDVELLDMARVNEAIEDCFPMRVTGKIVVCDEETAQGLRIIDTHDLLNVVRRAVA